MCSDSKDFKVDAGELRLIGPSPLTRTFTCVSGQACSLQDITGQNLGIADKYARGCAK